MGGGQNYDPFLVVLKNVRCRTIIGMQKGTIILTTTHIDSVTTPPLMLAPPRLALKQVEPIGGGLGKKGSRGLGV